MSGTGTVWVGQESEGGGGRVFLAGASDPGLAESGSGHLWNGKGPRPGAEGRPGRGQSASSRAQAQRWVIRSRDSPNGPGASKHRGSIETGRIAVG